MFFIVIIWLTLGNGVHMTNWSETLWNCTSNDTLSGFQNMSGINSSSSNNTFQHNIGNRSDVIRNCGYNESDLIQVDGNKTLNTTAGFESVPHGLNGSVHRYRGRDVLICHGFSCAGRCDAPRQDLTVANCFCDEVCVFYRDCCYDYFQECNFNVSVAIELKSLTDQEPHCSHIFQEEHALLVDHCHGDWSGDKERRQCEDEALEVQDIFTIMPVTHKAVQVAFKNIYCAHCNFLKLDSLQYWEFNISCLDNDTLNVVGENGVSVTTLEILKQTGCHIRLRPHDPELINHVRFCNPRFVNACRSEHDHDLFSAYNMTQNTDRLGDGDACQDYAAYVTTPTRYVAKNTHCALCMNNNIDVKNLTCPRRDDLLLDFFFSLRGIGLPPFSVLLDFNGYHWTLSKRTESPKADDCSVNLFLHNGMCRETICQLGLQRKDDMCVPPSRLGNSNIRIEFLVSGSKTVAGLFEEILIHEAHDHGVSVSNITTETPTDNHFPTGCGGAMSIFTTPNLVDFDIMIPQNATSLAAVLSYVDDLINSTELDLANVRISNIAYDIRNASVCQQIENFTIVVNSPDVLLLSADNKLHEPDEVSWEITWESRCVHGRLKHTTNKVVKGCVRRQSSCLLVEILENEVDELNPNLNETQITVLNDSLYVCSSALKNISSSFESHDFETDIIEGILTVVLLSISMVMLVLTLITHCLIHRLKSLPGKIVLSLSVAILFAQAFFLTLEVATSIQWLCKAVAMVDHFFWLSSFSWSNILALDLEVTLTQSTKIGASRDNGHPFLRYSLYGWGMLFVVVTVVALVSFATDLPISYGNEQICWILGKEALLLTFALPVALAVVLNCILLSRAIYFVYKVGKLVKNASIVTDQKLKGFLYAKLIILMGLTWLFGILGTILRSTTLMYMFTVLNALQGVYIFIAFAANKRVFMFYLKLISDKTGTSKYFSSQKSTASFTSASKLSSN